MNLKVQNLYDSHVHFLGTAEYLEGFSLSGVGSLNELAKIPIPANSWRSNFLIGFGWDPKLINASDLIAKALDQIFPNFPVMLSRNDGHASWLNTKALEQLNFAESSGVLYEADHFLALEKLPIRTKAELKSKLLEASKIFLNRGFTHLRDLTSSTEEWEALVELSREGLFHQNIELNFLIKKIENLEERLKFMKSAQKTEIENVQIQGIKIFYDGTLGGGNAFVSNCACCRDGQYWGQSSFTQVLKSVWDAGFELSVHCIGDDAVDDIVTWTREASASGLVGRLNIEHAEFIRPETIQKMKPLHIRVHMQPCHWFDDQKWLLNKAPEHLKRNAFPWEALRKAKIPIQFGSDSPVVAPSLFSNLKALQESKSSGIACFEGDPISFHTHLGSKTHGESVFVDEKLVSVRINGTELYIPE